MTFLVIVLKSDAIIHQTTVNAHTLQVIVCPVLFEIQLRIKYLNFH